MDYFSIIVGAICGAIGGVIGSLLGRRVKNQLLKIFVIVLPIVLSIQIGPVLVKKLGLREKFVPTSVSDKVSRIGTEAAKSEPKVLDSVKGMSADQARAFTQEKSSLGVKRLSFADLKEWNRLRIRMAETNQVVCAGLWTGKGLTADLLMGTLGKMDDSDVEAWMKISMKAARLEIEQQAFAEPSPEAVKIGLEKIGAALSPEDSARFNKALVDGVNAANDEACWVIKTLMTNAKSLSDSEQEQFLRAFASI